MSAALRMTFSLISCYSVLSDETCLKHIQTFSGGFSVPDSAPGGPEDEPNDDETFLKHIKTFSRVHSMIPPFINSPTVGASVGASVNSMYCSRCMMVSCFHAPCFSASGCYLSFLHAPQLLFHAVVVFKVPGPIQAPELAHLIGPKL